MLVMPPGFRDIFISEHLHSFVVTMGFNNWRFGNVMFPMLLMHSRLLNRMSVFAVFLGKGDSVYPPAQADSK
jgi:hypothetical protein